MLLVALDGFVERFEGFCFLPLLIPQFATLTESLYGYFFAVRLDVVLIEQLTVFDHVRTELTRHGITGSEFQ